MSRALARWGFSGRRGALAAALIFGLLSSGAAVAVGFIVSQSHRPADHWTIHEWGTFTALENERGESLGGINVDDELLPKFVHSLSPNVIGAAHGQDQFLFLFTKGVPPHYPYVTMRLETPVVYFHPPLSLRQPQQVDFDVSLRGGWLTQFYPAAKAAAPGLSPDPQKIAPITRDTIGRLSWHNLSVGTAGHGPTTDEHVWLAPRNVEAANVTTADGESERYLFYRGVANFSAPLQAVADDGRDELALHGRFEEVLSAGQQAQIGRLWLVHILADGRVAYRTAGPMSVTGDPQAIIGRVPKSFVAGDFATANLDGLRADLHAALVADGLYADEASALIETWNQAYFRSAGLRLFFLVPQCWTDHYLPLSVSVPADVRRVMVGRIELVSPEQRPLLKKLAAISKVDAFWTSNIPDSPSGRKFREGRGDFGDLGVKIPSDYQSYLDLGRFRNALVLDQQRRHPTPGLANFIDRYGLDQFQTTAAAKK